MRNPPVDPILLHLTRQGVAAAWLAPPTMALLLSAPFAISALGVAAVYPYAVLAGTAALLYLAYGRYADPARHAPRRRAGDRDRVEFPPLPSVPTVSVLLAVHDNPAAVDAVLALMASDHPALEVIVVDDGGAERTTAALARLAAELPVTVLRLDHRVGRRRALLHAAGHATGDLLAFAGDRCLVAPDAIRRCVAALTGHPALGAVCAHTRALDPDGGALARGQDACAQARFRVVVAAAAGFGTVADLPGGLTVYRRDAIYNYLPAWDAGRPLAALVLGQPWLGQKIKIRYADSPFVREADHPALPWRVGYVRSARAYAAAPAGPADALAQAMRRAVAPLRAARFTVAFAWRLGPAPAALHYVRLLAQVCAPPAAAWHLLWEPAHGRWAPAVAYLVAMALAGAGYWLADGIEHLGRGGAGRPYQPVAHVLAALIQPMLPAYALVSGIRRRLSTAG